MNKKQNHINQIMKQKQFKYKNQRNKFNLMKNKIIIRKIHIISNLHKQLHNYVLYMDRDKINNKHYKNKSNMVCKLHNNKMNNNKIQ